jgi:hypothetical protein
MKEMEAPCTLTEKKNDGLIISLNRVLLGKLTVAQLVKKFSPFQETQRIITVFTTAQEHE